ncbi:MAG: hypothetical protein RQ856_05245 [Candidatus Izemoplasmatales bacterium]|nr:hypothetical protein [Candidatus Izemoplasmatales bacterium]
MNRFDTSIKYLKFKDLFFVILYGGVLSLLLGVLLGFADYYISTYIRISFAGILFFLSSMQVGKMVRKQYEFPHIVYIVITGIFLVMQAMIIFFLPFIFRIVLENNSPELVFDLRLYWVVMQNFFVSLFTQFNINLWLTVFIFGIGTYLGVKKTY